MITYHSYNFDVVGLILIMDVSEPLLERKLKRANF